MSHESTRCISILFYTNKHDEIEINCVILENMSLLYSAKALLCKNIQAYQNPSYVNTKNFPLK